MAAPISRDKASSAGALEQQSHCINPPDNYKHNSVILYPIGFHFCFFALLKIVEFHTSGISNGRWAQVPKCNSRPQFGPIYPTAYFSEVRVNQCPNYEQMVKKPMYRWFIQSPGVRYVKNKMVLSKRLSSL